MLSKSLESALSAMALLSEIYDGETTLTADEIAARQKLNRPFVAKLLTSLSAAGLVTSKPGRNGGFALAVPPEEITLLAIGEAIGYRSRIVCCPFGPKYGEQADSGHCPMHEQLCDLRDHLAAFLSSNTLHVFAAGLSSSDL